MTENIQYIGELLWPGKVGHYLLVTAFVTSILSAISYYKATRETDQGESWKRLGRYSFYIHGVSVIGAIVILFTLMLTHRYEIGRASCRGRVEFLLCCGSICTYRVLRASADSHS